MPLSSSSSLSDIVAAYVDNAAYRSEESVTMARDFATACRILLVKRPKRAKNGQEEIELDPTVIQAELQQAEQWIAVVGQTGGGVVDLSFSEFRD